MVTHIENEAVNCEACGQEYISKDLKKIKIANMGVELRLCPECSSRDSAGDYASAINDLKNVF